MLAAGRFSFFVVVAPSLSLIVALSHHRSLSLSLSLVVALSRRRSATEMIAPTSARKASACLI